MQPSINQLTQQSINQLQLTRTVLIEQLINEFWLWMQNFIHCGSTIKNKITTKQSINQNKKSSNISLTLSYS